MPAAQPRAAAGAGTAPDCAAGRASGVEVPAFGFVQPDAAQRRQKRRSLGISLLVQVGLWLVLFWSFGRAQFASPRWQAPPEKLTWLTAPVLPRLASPPPLLPRRLVRAKRAAPFLPLPRARRHIAAVRRPARQGRPRAARLWRAPRVSAPVFVARAAAPAAPDPVSQPAVVMGVLPRVPDPRPPRPAAHAAVRLGAFADPPPAAGRPAPVAAGPRVGAFGAATRAAALPAVAAAAAPAAAPRARAVRLGGFHAAAPTPAAAPHGSAPAVQINTRVFHPAAAAAPGRLASARHAPVAAYVPPLILFKPQPVYPAAAKARGIQGVVVLRVVLTAAGRVRVLAVERSLGRACDQAARQAALRIRFRPARRYGRPVDAVVRIRVRFRVAD